MDTIANGSPPSDYAIHALVEGEPGAASRVLGLTLLRSAIIAPGLFLFGLRGRDLVIGSLAASASVTVMMTAYYVARR